jgi:hypothetical protein
MIKLDMIKKQTRLVNEKAFDLENNILILCVDVGDYDLTGKTITAVFSPSGVETAPLTTVDNIIQIPIYAEEVRYGINCIQLNFRWGGNCLEQSPIMQLHVEKSLKTTKAESGQIDIITHLIAEVTKAKEDADEALTQANRIVGEAGDIRAALDGSTEAAGTAKENLDGSISLANNINNTLSNPETGTIKQATDANHELQGAIEDSGTAKNELQEVINNSKINELIKISPTQPSWGLWLEEVM